MRLGLNQLKTSISIHPMESENNSILINTQTNYEDSSAYSPEKGFGAYQGNEYGAPSGLHPDYGMIKRSSTIRHTSSPQVAMSAVGQTSGKPPTVKSTRKPPKAPRELQMPHPQDLSSKFKPEEISSKEDEKESPSVSETTSKSPIKKNAEIEEPEKKLNLKKVQPPASSKKLLNSEKQLLKTKNKLQGLGSKLKVNGKDKVKARERKENLLVLGNVSFEESGDGESSSEFEGEEDDDQAYVHDKPIETIGDLLQIFGGKIEEELDNELHIRVPNSDNVVKVPKNIFTGLCAKCSQTEVVVSDLVAPDVGLTKLPLNNVNTQVPKLSHYDKSPILHSNLDFNNLRVADDMATDRKVQSIIDTARESSAKPPAGNNLNDILKGLEEMSNNSTLMDGLDDDDDDTPPPLGPKKNFNPVQLPAQVQQEKKALQEEEKTIQEQLEIQKKKFHQIKTMSLRVSNYKIYDPTTKILELEEQLRIKNSEIERLMLQMHAMNSHQMMPYSHPGGEPDDIMYHLAFLFSSPLVRRTNTNLEIIMQLDYHTEIKNIEKQLKGVKHEIRYKVDVATKSNFRGVIADAPFALHFTGHGIQNDQKALGTAYFQHKDKGDILLLEDENGMADYLFAKELQKVVELSKSNSDFSHNYEVVFVSSCYSEFTGKIFLESGARHVICIDKDERISDKASLRFSQVFYETLFVKKYSVCKAFELAKDDIRTLINNNEASKFKIMVSDNVEFPGSKKASQHKCFPIAKFKEGTLTKYDTIPFFDCFPASVENFKGRQQEMCEVITLLSTNRLVNILGPPGIGKTSFARNLCNHIKDRKKYFDGILYVSLRG